METQAVITFAVRSHELLQAVTAGESEQPDSTPLLQYQEGSLQISIPISQIIALLNATWAIPSKALSPREQEVVRLIGDGHKPNEIGEMLEIAEQTVRANLRVIFLKLHVVDKAELQLYVKLRPEILI